jgi:hypothetical protein
MAATLLVKIEIDRSTLYADDCENIFVEKRWLAILIYRSHNENNACARFWLSKEKDTKFIVAFLTIYVFSMILIDPLSTKYQTVFRTDVHGWKHHPLF